jgi:hypothetical protein
MRRNLRALWICAVVVVMIAGSCKDDDPSEAEVQTNKLVGTWIIGQQGYVKRDDITSNEWNDFTLTLTNTAYTSNSNYTAVWPTQGTWKFAGGNINRIEREDGLPIDIEITESTLKLTFMQPEAGSSGRLSGVSGEYVFFFHKQ